jgi:SEC-C motif-containing protein
LIAATQAAVTAEQLMRSRYSAFALVARDPQAIEHLLRTHPETAQTPAARRKALRASCRTIEWIGLTVLDGQSGGPLDQHGTVTFEARWRDRHGREGVLKECSVSAVGNPANGSISRPSASRMPPQPDQRPLHHKGDRQGGEGMDDHQHDGCNPEELTVKVIVDLCVVPIGVGVHLAPTIAACESGSRSSPRSSPAIRRCMPWAAPASTPP